MKTNSKSKWIVPVFTSVIPNSLERDKLYISLDYNSAAHLCACGCGEEVVTPLQPTAWKVIYDGESVSLHPSIGNWSYKCRSHYWVKNNQIVWAEDWSDAKIKRSRELETQNNKQLLNESHQNNSTEKSAKGHIESQRFEKSITLWDVIKSLFK